jgi:hypothetical protein
VIADHSLPELFHGGGDRPLLRQLTKLDLHEIGACGLLHEGKVGPDVHL